MVPISIFRLIQEDQIICSLVNKNGPSKWSQMAEQLYQIFGDFKKSGKQCRQRWYNHLDPNLIKKSWTSEEQDLLFQLHKKIGNKWTIIANKLIGRSDNSIKNHFYSTIRKSLRRINKFLGSKEGTIIVKKIKPSILSKVFQLIEKDSQTQIAQQKQTLEQFMKCKQTAYHLINFSRWKLSDSRSAINKEDGQKLQKILSEIIKINDSISQQKKQAVAAQQNNSDFKEHQQQIKSQLINIKQTQKMIGQNQNYFIELNSNQIDKRYSNPTVSSPKLSVIPLTHNFLKLDSNKKFVQNQQIILGHSNIDNFNFNIQLDEHIMQMQINMSPWANVTPYIITPSRNKNNLQKQMCFNFDDCNQLTDKIANQIKKNTQLQTTNFMIQENNNSSQQQYLNKL